MLFIVVRIAAVALCVHSGMLLAATMFLVSGARDIKPLLVEFSNERKKKQ